MIYLNDVEEGGETDFDKINYKFSPQKRMAVVWKNSNGSGSENSASHHAGMPVKKGKKIVITKWFRENHYNPLEDQKLSLMTHNNKTFSTYNDLPKYSSNGFKIIKCPSDAWNLIMEGYKVLKNNIKEEQFVGKEHVIKGEGNTSDLMSFDEIPTLRNLILEKLKPTHEEFCKENIEPVALYGIRSYNRGSTLINHRDRPQTHHVSSIIIVDKDLDCGCSPTKGTINDWPLDIQDHEGNWHQIYAEIGDMILYESAVCEHGRNQPFLGNWFRSCFAHYKLSDYQYIGSPNE
jgi:prolyl 4-hydroxylase